jgi:hypothetical protein
MEGNIYMAPTNLHTSEIITCNNGTIITQQDRGFDSATGEPLPPVYFAHTKDSEPTRQEHMYHSKWWNLLSAEILENRKEKDGLLRKIEELERKIKSLSEAEAWIETHAAERHEVETRLVLCCERLEEERDRTINLSLLLLMIAQGKCITSDTTHTRCGYCAPCLARKGVTEKGLNNIRDAWKRGVQREIVDHLKSLMSTDDRKAKLVIDRDSIEALVGLAIDDTEDR